MPSGAYYKDRVITLGTSDKARLLFADFDRAGEFGCLIEVTA